MLDTAEKKQKAFERYEEEDANFRVELEREREREEESVDDGVEVQSGCPIEDDWFNVRRMCHFLQHFYELTLRVSGSSFVTSNQLFNELADVDCLLKKWMRSQDFKLSLMATKMKAKYDSNWGEVDKLNLVMFLAVVVDLRHKLNYAEFAIQSMYDGEEGIQLSRKVHGAVYEMFEEYKKMCQSNEDSQSQNEMLANGGLQGAETEGTIRNEMLKLYKRKQIESGAGEFKSELQKYLSDTNEEYSGKFDILDWWKKNNSRYPTIASMARDLLAVPISTIASESAFSTRGRVLGAFRSSLTPKIAEALICAQDWFRGGPIRVEENLENLERLENDFGRMSVGGTASCVAGIESNTNDML